MQHINSAPVFSWLQTAHIQQTACRDIKSKRSELRFVLGPSFELSSTKLCVCVCVCVRVCVHARACSSISRVQLFAVLRTVAHTRLLCPWNSPGKNTGVGSHFLLQGIFLTQGSNLGLLHYGQILYHLSHPESPQPN